MTNNEVSATNNKTRNYGIDLLRLVAMFMVVILHILGQGGVLSNITGLTIKGEIYWSIEITCYCAVNVYAIISGYVGYQSNHKSSNIIKLCLQLVFYSIIITFVSIISAFIKNESISLGQIMLYLFPTIDSYWYFSAYFCLFFFMPILNTVINNSDRHMLKKAGVVIFIIFCCWTQIYEQVSFRGKGYSVLWLSILYMLGAYIKKYDSFEKLSKRKCFVGYILFILITIITRIVIGIISTVELNLTTSRLNT